MNGQQAIPTQNYGQDRNPTPQTAKMLPQHFDLLADRLNQLSLKVHQLEDFGERIMGCPIPQNPSNPSTKSDKPTSVPGLMAINDANFSDLLNRLEGIIKHLNCVI